MAMDGASSAQTNNIPVHFVKMPLGNLIFILLTDDPWQYEQRRAR
jgi:hypothetical protein